MVTCARTPRAAATVAEEIAAVGGDALGLEIDCADRKACDTLVSKTMARFGALDILVCNHGIGLNKPAEAVTPAEWNEMLRINLTGYFFAAQAAAQPMLAQKRGAIVMNSSNASFIGYPGLAAYGASKGGVDMMMRSLAQEVAPRLIRVNAIAPGAVRTPINTSAWNTPAAYADLMTLVPYKRIGEPDDIARAAVWLASDAADYVTGATLFVDGGMALYPGFATGG